MSGTAVVLAAGQGKRMKSDLPKVLHPIGGRPMVEHVLDTATEAGFTRHIVVVGHGRERVEAALRGRDVSFALQAEQLGTGHAVQVAAPLLETFDGDVAILCGDVPLLSARTLSALHDVHEKGGYAGTVLTFSPADATGYGRIYRDEKGDVTRIVEQRDLPRGEAHPGEVNSGTYCFRWPDLRTVLKELQTDNDQGEYYLTDTLALLRRRNARVGGYETTDPIEVSGVNDPEQLAELEREWRKRRGAGAS